MTSGLLGLPIPSWAEWFVERGGRPFHAPIAARWVFHHEAVSWDRMTDLPLSLRLRLQEEAPLLTARIEKVREARDGAKKILLRLSDGAFSEAVAMPGTQGTTFCISTQVGCPIRCTFCASGLEGLERNLSCGETLEQILLLKTLERAPGRLVIMGMGEPGHNLEPTLAALDTLFHPSGGGWSPRRVTLSTVGPRGILPRLTGWGPPIQVALSLHAPDDKLRRELIPGIGRRTLEETLAEADRLFARTRRRYTIEYVLLAGVNDSPAQARTLGNLLAGRPCHANLIPYNPVAGLSFRRPRLEEQTAFAGILRRHGLSATLRRSLGGEVDAACGQLRRRAAGQSGPAPAVPSLLPPEPP